MTEHRTVGALALAADSLPVTRLTCHASHSDPKKKGKVCGGLLGDVPGKYEFVTLAKRMPAELDGYVWLRCSNARCGTWNKFRILPSQQAVVAAAEESSEGALSRLPELQQRAVLALAGGLSVTATAAAIGVDRGTVIRWQKDPLFTRVRQTIGPQLSAAHLQTAFAAIFDVIEQDRKKGRARHAVWIATRLDSMLSAFERSRAAARGNNVNVGVSMSQSQEQTESSIKREWEVRTRGISAPVASEE